MIWCIISYVIFGMWISFQCIILDKYTDIESTVKNKKPIVDYTFIILVVSTLWFPLGIFMVGSVIWELYHEKS